MERRLAAILAADAVGYSRLMGADEEAAFAALNRRREIIDAVIAQHGGRIFGSAGDSVIAEFTSSVEAVRCALQIQAKLGEVDLERPPDERMAFRIGVNFGDVMVHDGDLLGDGVNVAARLEALAPAGGICISAPIAEQIAGKLDADFARAGRHRLKNIAAPVAVSCWPPEAAAKLRRSAIRWRRLALAGVPAVAAAGILVAAMLEDRTHAPLPVGARLVTIPFERLDGNGADDYFASGLTKDINAYLSKFSNLFVIAPDTANAFRDATCAQIRDELDADYILRGTIRQDGDQVRVTTAFTDSKTCRQLPAPGPFDRDMSVTSILDIQLEIAQKVVAEVGSADAPLFNAHVQAEIRDKAPGSVAAYRCVLLSYWFYETFEPDRHRRARSCLERAVKEDPSYALGWSRLAFSYIESKKYAIDTPGDWAALSREAANRSLELDPDNPDAYYALAILSQMTGEEHEVFRNFAEKAIALNPNDAFVLADLGTWMAYSGKWELGKEWVARAKALNPKHQSWLDYIWHLHHYLEGEYAAARDVALKINLPKNYMVQASLTAAYAMNGETGKAARALEHLLALRPDYGDDPRAPFRARGMPRKLIEKLMDGLRKAGLDVPEA